MQPPPRNTLGYTPGGSRLTRLDPQGPPAPRVPADDALLAAVEAHLDAHFPGPGDVLVPADWDGVRIALHVRAPTGQRPFWVFLTSGMASSKMKKPHGKLDPRIRFHGELFLKVDAAWPGFRFHADAPRGERFDPDIDGEHAECVWPLVALVGLAEVPHARGLLLTPGSSVPHGGPYAPDTALSGAIVFGILPDDVHAETEDAPPEEPPFARFSHGGHEVGVMQVVLVDDREMEMKVQFGPKLVLPLLHQVGAFGPLGAERGNAADEAERLVEEAGGVPEERFDTLAADPHAPFGDEPLLHGPGGYRVDEHADAEAPTLASLSGRWRITMYGEGGEYAPAGTAEEMRLEVEYDGSRYATRRAGEVVDTGRVALTADPGTDTDPSATAFAHLTATPDRAHPDDPHLHALVRLLPAVPGRPREAEQLTALPPGTRLAAFDYPFGTPASYARLAWAAPPRGNKPKPRKRPGRARRR